MVPMHVWTPDVYQGAPTAVSAFISVVSKSAGFVFAIRLFSYAFADQRQLWEPLVMVCAVLTMTVGNLAAIPQKSVKRLLAYSSISQAGYLLVGFLGNPSTGTSAVLFYLFVYTVTNIAAFAAVIAFSSATGSDDWRITRGLPAAARCWPWFSPSRCFRSPASRRWAGSSESCTCSPPPWNADTSGWSSWQP